MNNIILGNKLYVDHAGVMEVRSLHTTRAMMLTFKQGGRTFSRNYHKVVGHIVPENGKAPSVAVEGYWDRYLEATFQPDTPPERIWEKT